MGNVTASGREKLLAIQALRGYAALSVVAYHAVNQWSTHLDQPIENFWSNGSAGVDIFFVISGLVMVLSAQRIAHRSGAEWLFLRQRLIRIVPLYWIMTTVKICAVLAFAGLVSRTRLDLWYVLGSYLFLPVPNANGSIIPVLAVGWTLSYEMLFYLLVALALACGVSLFRVSVPALILFAIAGWRHLFDFANTLVLEFLFGAVIGANLAWFQRLPLELMASLLLAALAALLCMPQLDAGWGQLRPLVWGLPAALAVASAATLERHVRTPRSWVRVGEASYSIYLSHEFVVPTVYLIIARSRLVPLSILLPVTLAATLTASIIVGAIVYDWVERPLLRFGRRLLASGSSTALLR